MELKSKVVTYIHFDIQLDDKYKISYDLLYKLLLDDYEEYFLDIFKYNSSSKHSIADIEINYDGLVHVEFTNWRSYLPFFEYLESLYLIEIDRTHYSGPHVYIITDMIGLQKKINEVVIWLSEISNNMEAYTRDAKIEHLLT